VPTGSPLRHLILVVDAYDAGGGALRLLTGPVRPNWADVGDTSEAQLDGRAGRVFVRWLAERWSHRSPTGAYWNPTRVVEDTRLAAFATDRSRYVFAVVPDGEVSVDVQLLYRRAFRALADRKRWRAPDIVMASKGIVLPPPLGPQASEANEPSTKAPTTRRPEVHAERAASSGRTEGSRSVKGRTQIFADRR
jgi:hypothetical protein